MLDRLGFIAVFSLVLVSCLVVASFFSSPVECLSFQVLNLPSDFPVHVFVEGELVSSLSSNPLGILSFSVDASRSDSVVLVSGGHRFDVSGFSDSPVPASYVRERGGFWECFFLSFIILLLFVSWFMGFNLFGEVIVGCVIGLVWEVLTVPWWFYHGAQFIVFGVPVAVVLWWGFNLGLASFLSQLVFVYSSYNFSRDRAMRVLVYMFMVGVVCIPMEFVGWRLFDLWDYVWTPFWLVCLCWFWIGTLMLSAIDVLNEPFDRVFGFVPVLR